MKYQEIKFAVVAVAILALFGCGKKGGGGSTAKTPTSNSYCGSSSYCYAGTGSLGNIGRRVWNGDLRVTNNSVYREFMRDTGACRNSSDCSNLDRNLDLIIALRDGRVPGQARFQLRTGGNNRYSRSCTITSSVRAQVARNNRGILMNYDVDESLNNCDSRGNGGHYKRRRRNGLDLDISIGVTFPGGHFEIGTKDKRHRRNKNKWQDNYDSRYDDDLYDLDDRYQRNSRYGSSSSGMLQIVTDFKTKSRYDTMKVYLHYEGKRFAEGTMQDDYYDRGFDSYEYHRSSYGGRYNTDYDDGLFFGFRL